MKRGFTLIEIIIYITISAVVLIAVTYFSIDATRSQSKAYIIGEVNQNMRFAMDTMSRAIRGASDITSLSSSTAVLDYGSAPDITLKFDGVNSKITYRVGTGVEQDLTSGRVLATGSFFDMSATSTRDILINLDIDFNQAGTEIDFNYGTSASTTVSLRNY